MHYSAKRGLAITCRLSVRPSVTLVDHDHIYTGCAKKSNPLRFLADRTIGRAYGTVCRLSVCLSVVCL